MVRDGQKAFAKICGFSRSNPDGTYVEQFRIIKFLVSSPVAAAVPIPASASACLPSVPALSTTTSIATLSATSGSGVARGAVPALIAATGILALSNGGIHLIYVKYLSHIN